MRRHTHRLVLTPIFILTTDRRFSFWILGICPKYLLAERFGHKTKIKKFKTSVRRTDHTMASYRHSQMTLRKVDVRCDYLLPLVERICDTTCHNGMND